MGAGQRRFLKGEVTDPPSAGRRSDPRSHEGTATLTNSKNKVKGLVPSAGWEGREINQFHSASATNWSPAPVGVTGIVHPNGGMCEPESQR